MLVEPPSDPSPILSSRCRLPVGLFNWKFYSNFVALIFAINLIFTKLIGANVDACWGPYYPTLLFSTFY